MAKNVRKKLKELAQMLTNALGVHLNVVNVTLAMY